MSRQCQVGEAGKTATFRSTRSYWDWIAAWMSNDASEQVVQGMFSLHSQIWHLAPSSMKASPIRVLAAAVPKGLWRSSDLSKTVTFESVLYRSPAFECRNGLTT